MKIKIDEDFLKAILIIVTIVAVVIFFGFLVGREIWERHHRIEEYRKAYGQSEQFLPGADITVCSCFFVHLLSTGDFYYKISKWYIIPIKWYKVANKEKSFFMPRA